MIIRKKRKTRLINGGDGIDHSESFEKSAPGFHSSGYSYSSSTTKTFAEQYNSQEDRERNAIGHISDVSTLTGAGAVAGYAYGKSRGEELGKKAEQLSKTAEGMSDKANQAYDEAVKNIRNEQNAALEARKKKNWFKRLFGTKEKTINAEAEKKIQQAAEENSAMLGKASKVSNEAEKISKQAKKSMGKWTIIGTGLGLGTGLLARKYWRSKHSEQGNQY